MPRPLIEILCGSVEDAVLARSAGADRIEYNSAVGLGGLTPSFGAFQAVRRACDLPIMVMIRPRESGFLYDDAECEAMAADIRTFRSAGADGFVFAVLTETGELNEPRSRRLIEAAGDRPCILNRAFDLVPDMARGLESAISAGYRRVMTSGQAERCQDGTDAVRRLIAQSAGRIETLPAGGISAVNVEQIVRETGANQIHAGLRGTRRDPSVPNGSAIRFGSRSAAEEGTFDRLDEEKLRKLVAVIREMPT